MRNKTRMLFQLTTLLLFLVLVITSCSPGEKSDSSGGQPGAVSSDDKSAATMQDGTHVPETFKAQGGTGKVKITCPEVTLTQGEASAD